MAGERIDDETPGGDRLLALVLLLLILLPRVAFATGADTTAVPPVDPAPCLAAILANDDEKTLAECGPVIDSGKTEKADRLKALIARGAVLTRKEEIDRALSDYDVALRLDSTQADLWASGETAVKSSLRSTCN